MRSTAPIILRDPLEVLFLCPSFRARTTLEVDLSQCSWISPFGVVAVLAATLRAHARHLSVAVALPTDQMVRTYLGRIGFVAELARQGFHVDGDLEMDDGYQVATCLPVASLATPDEVEAASSALYDELTQDHVPLGIFDKVMNLAIELTQNAKEASLGPPR